jgi:hypothetical protein
MVAAVALPVRAMLHASLIDADARRLAGIFGRTWTTEAKIEEAAGLATDLETHAKALRAALGEQVEGERT